MPLSPLQPGEKLYCVSYAPFHGSQTPLDLSTRIEPAQIERDLEQLSKITDCVRTYSVDFGLDRVPDIARRFGLKVFLGLWVSNNPDRTRLQIDTGIALARRFPDVIRGVIVGNEVLLNNAQCEAQILAYLQAVRAQVPAGVPVTYVDTWNTIVAHPGVIAAVQQELPSGFPEPLAGAILDGLKGSAERLEKQLS